MAIFECVPNISEGRRSDVVVGIVDAMRRVSGARLLDVSSDASHNRSVITMAGDAAPLKAAALALFEAALASIDLRRHKGEHPRVGAVDVVPFVPIEGETMEWNAKLDFGDRKEIPKPLSVWEKYAQVLLMSNQLAFLD